MSNTDWLQDPTCWMDSVVMHEQVEEPLPPAEMQAPYVTLNVMGYMGRRDSRDMGSHRVFSCLNK